MVQFIWEFIVRPDKIEEFERSYSASGPWTQLFRQSPGYQSTQLLRDNENARRFLTIDRWDTIASYRAMRERFAKEYEVLDRAYEAFTESERSIGIFEAVPEAVALL